MCNGNRALKRMVSFIMLICLIVTVMPLESAVDRVFGQELNGQASREVSMQVEGSAESVILHDESAKNELYTYEIYYFNQATMLNKGELDIYGSDLYIYNTEPGVVDNTSLSFHECYYDLENGITWVKGTIQLPYKNLGIIGRDIAGDWSGGQDGNQYFNLINGQGAVIWYVHGNGIYTAKPEVAIAEDRYVLLEYERDDNDYSGWNLYTWNSGFGGNVSIPFERLNDGRYAVKVPIKQTVSTLMFCIERNNWAEKDGGDHGIVTPLEQTIIKTKMLKGGEPVLQYPYNMGYEVDTLANVVYFYYRDDGAYVNDSLEELKGNVFLNYDGQRMTMNYDSDNQRYVVKLPLMMGAHYYSYEVNGVVYNDKYNSDSTSEGSLFRYDKFMANIKASINTAALNYNQNAVLHVQVEGIGGSDIAGLKIEEVYADLSELGGDRKTEIDTSLMELSINLQDNISAGLKRIPVVMTDQFGNLYEAETNVTVNGRSNSASFGWDEAIIYFIVTDRFKDGNAANNGVNGEDTYGDNPGLSHGGDFAGVTDKLDYLEELGINTIWITPIVDNIEGVAVTGQGSADVPYNSAYHGYWAKNFEALNPSLGTEAELRTLIEQAHQKGIKVMVDIVINHAGYGTEAVFLDMLRDPKDCVADSEILQQLAGLPDFATEKEEVRTKLIEWQTAWVEGFGIDYFRVDTVKHVDKTTWSQLKNELTKINPDFKLIGEYYGAGHANNFGYLNSGTMDSLLDFDFNNKAEEFVTGRLESVEAFLEARNGMITNTAGLGGFLSSHDEDGLLYQFEKSFDKETAEGKMMVAAALLLTAKGQPVIYYGEEIGQTGANDYPYQTNRYDFDWTLVNDENTMLKHYKQLLSFRNQHSKVFAKGTRKMLAGSDREEFIVFERSYGLERIVVGLNISDESKDANITIQGAGNRVITDRYSGRQYRTSSDGVVTVTIPAAGAGGCVLLEIGGNTSGAGNDNNNSDTRTGVITRTASGSERRLQKYKVGILLKVLDNSYSRFLIPIKYNNSGEFFKKQHISDKVNIVRIWKIFYTYTIESMKEV